MPLTTIAQPLKAECDKLGISALLSSEVLEIYISPPRPPGNKITKKLLSYQVGPGDFERELLLRPTVLIMSVEYTVAPENIPIFIQKFFISVEQVICAFKSI